MPINSNTLQELVPTYVVTKHLRNGGIADEWEVEYHPYVPDERTIRILLTGKIIDRHGEAQVSNLAELVPKA